MLHDRVKPAKGGLFPPEIAQKQGSEAVHQVFRPGRRQMHAIADQKLVPDPIEAAGGIAKHLADGKILDAKGFADALHVIGLSVDEQGCPDGKQAAGPAIIDGDGNRAGCRTKRVPAQAR